jgi:hypothetical protein
MTCRFQRFIPPLELVSKHVFAELEYQFGVKKSYYQIMNNNWKLIYHIPNLMYLVRDGGDTLRALVLER